MKDRQYSTPYYNDPIKREVLKKNMREYAKEYRKKNMAKIKKYRKEYFRRPEVRARINASRKKKYNSN